MKLSTIGAIVQGFWYEIPKHFSFVELGEFTVMPNHVHGILILDKNDDTKTGQSNVVETLQCNVSTHNDEKQKNEFYKNISPKSGSVSSIIRSFKSICTKHIHAAFPHLNFEWQERFWDTIIRDDEAFQRISNYIINNPLNWNEDKFYGEDKEMQNQP